VNRVQRTFETPHFNPSSRVHTTLIWSGPETDGFCINLAGQGVKDCENEEEGHDDH
jgi:hypothetical protein